MWVPGAVWTGVKNFIPAGIRSPNRPSLSESLCSLSYPSPHIFTYNITKFSFPAGQKKNQQAKAKISWKMYVQIHSSASLDFACSKQEVDKLLRRYERCSDKTKKSRSKSRIQLSYPLSNIPTNQTYKAANVA
jgi:hypothetical protein